MGLFITFEGGEGSGKSVQSRALYRKLNRSGIPSLLTHEPGGTRLGDRLSRLLKFGHGIGMLPLTELLMFNTSRAQLISEVINPGLHAGKVVICDRYTDSTVAYQHCGRGLDLSLVMAVNDAATGGLKPDITFLLDVPVEVGLVRKGKFKPDRFELEDAAFHRKVREGYLRMADAEPSRWNVIDACLPKDQISRAVRQKIGKYFRFNLTETPILD